MEATLSPGLLMPKHSDLWVTATEKNTAIYIYIYTQTIPQLKYFTDINSNGTIVKWLVKLLTGHLRGNPSCAENWKFSFKFLSEDPYKSWDQTCAKSLENDCFNQISPDNHVELTDPKSWVWWTSSISLSSSRQMPASLSVVMAAGQVKTVKLKSQIPSLQQPQRVNELQQRPPQSHSTSPHADTCGLIAQRGKYPAHPVMMHPAKFTGESGWVRGRREREGKGWR